MNVCMTNFDMHHVGGTETWVMAVASGLRQLGHNPYCLSLKKGYLSQRYFDLIDVYGPADIRHMPRPEVLFYLHPLQFPDAAEIEKKVYCCLGWAWPDYPAIGQGPYMTMSDENKEYLRFLGVDAEVIYCPADLERFQSGPPLRKERPRVAAFSSRLLPYDMVKSCCEKLDWEWVEPASPRPVPHLERLFQEIDIVIGTEYVMLEAMASNRAPFVLGPWGWEGWITPGNVKYHAKHSQSGRGDPQPFEEEQLMAALSEYSPEMGYHGRSLCRAMFNPTTVASRLLEMACA